MNFDILSFGYAFVGGILIGLAAFLMLLFNGRIMGVSGIIGGLFAPSSRHQLWRVFFFLGILLGGLCLKLFAPFSLDNALTRSTSQLILAGILVGWGTRLGNGCTSGHGVCGVSRLSPRSLVATAVFMAFGILTVWVVNFWELT